MYTWDLMLTYVARRDIAKQIYGKLYGYNLQAIKQLDSGWFAAKGYKSDATQLIHNIATIQKDCLNNLNCEEITTEIYAIHALDQVLGLHGTMYGMCKCSICG